MTVFKFISAIFIVAFFFGFKPLTNPVYITGHLKKNPKDTFAGVEHLNVFVKGDNKILAKTITDNNGNFNLKFIPKEEKSFDFFCSGVGLDTLLVGSVKLFESDTPDMTFYIPVQYKKNAFGKVICPKCNKADKVLKIEYGIPSTVMHVNENGDTTHSLDNRRFQAGSCVFTGAKYFCNRDKIKF